MNKIYFDYAATTPTDPQVIKAMQPFWFERFGNASSPHAIGQDAQKALEESREILARFIGAKPTEIVFTSGATESSNHAISGIVHHHMDAGKDHIVVSAIEHHAVLEPVERLIKDGFRATFVPVDEPGRVDPKSVEDSITDKTLLVAVMHASNEIGTIQPIKEISQITQKHNIPFLVDAVQTVGHIPVDVKEMGCDLLFLSAHKFYGPKSVGALYIKEGTQMTPFLLGGDQERNRRASTQNVTGVVGMAKAVELCKEKMQQEIDFQTALCNQLIHEIPKRIKGVKINGCLNNRLPNNVHFSFEGLQGEALLMSLDMNDICASMGSACTSGAIEPSHVLRAIGLDDDLAYGSLRITLGRWTMREHIDVLLEKLPELVGTLRL